MMHVIKQRTHLKFFLKHFLVLSNHQPINPIIAGQGPVDQECRESLILDQDVGDVGEPEDVY